MSPVAALAMLVPALDDRVSLRWSDPQPLQIWMSDLNEKSLQKVDDPIVVPTGSIVTIRTEMK